MKNFTNTVFSNVALLSDKASVAYRTASAGINKKQFRPLLTGFMLFAAALLSTTNGFANRTHKPVTVTPTGANAVYCVGATPGATFGATITVDAAGAALNCSVTNVANVVTYQWYYNTTVTLAGATAVPGATGTFTLSNANASVITPAAGYIGACTPLTTPAVVGAKVYFVNLTWSAVGTGAPCPIAAGNLLSAAAATVTVNAYPTAVTATASPNPICSGTNLTLTGTATGATTYAWTHTGGTAITTPAALSTGVTGVVAANAGVYTLTASNGTCATSASSAAVTVNTTPTGVTATASPNPLCVGANLTLTGVATGATTYVWTHVGGTAITAPGSLSTGVTGVVAANAGIYTLTASTGSCSVTATSAAVTVNAYPTGVTATASPNPVCGGANLTLTGTATGATTYAWTHTGGTAITTPAALSTGVAGVVAANAGVYTLTASNGTCATSASSAAVTVNIAPTGVTATASPNPLCVGANLTLTGTATGATSYLWSHAGGAGITASGSLSTGVTGVVAGNAGIYTLSASNGTCSTTATSAAVTVNPYPTGVTAIASPNPVCAGANLTLTGTATGATTYAWTHTGGTAITTPAALSTGVTGVVAANAGSYTLTASNGTCATSASSAAVAVTPLPTGVTASATPNPLCVGYDLTLTGTATGATGYVWTQAGGTAITAPGSLSTGVTGVVAANAGVYTLTVSNSTCSVTATTAVVTVNPLPAGISGPGSVCVGQNVILTDLSGAGTWISFSPGIASVGSATGQVTGNAAGSTPITFTLNSTGCSSTTVETVNANPAPISGANNVCLTSSTTLSDSDLFGTWSSSAGGIAAVGSSTGVVTGVGLGSATITYTFISNGCYITQPMTVNPNPAAITGPTLTCAGSTVTLSDATTGGTWSSEEFWIATVGSTGVVTGVLGGGTSTISYTLPTACYATYTETVVTPPSVIDGDSTLCVTFSTTLTDSVSGGVWSSSAPGSAIANPSTGNILAINPGVVTIAYSITGCPAATHNVTVNAIPAPISGTSSLCDSVHASLYDLTLGGVWSSNNVITARVDSNTGIATGVSLGTTIISYTLSTGCYALLPVTVNPLAPPISGTDTICSTGTVWLTDIVGGGTWTSSNPAVGTITSTTGLLTGIVPGITYIVYTLPTGCTASLLETAIPPIPPISAPAEVCTGSIANMSNPQAGGIWSSANSYIASVVDTSGVATGHFPGTTTISYTKSAFKGCYSTVSILVDSLPNPVITYNFASHSVSTYNFYTAYQWSDSHTGAIPGAYTNTLVMPYANDSVFVTVTDTNGCVNRASWFFYDFTGVKNVSNANVHIYPNPATSVVYIDAAINLRAVITGIDGKTVLTQANVKEMNISALATGMYIMTLYDDEGTVVATQKMVKQ